MSWQIQITKAKPNPVGKDKSKWTPKPEQLLGEWADLKNVGDANVSLSAMHLAHREFSAGCVPKDAPVIYWNGPSTVLKVGETVRVHTGRSGDSWAMAAVDKSGVEHHAYGEKGSFVLNNDCGDALTVWWKDKDGKWHCDDSATYDVSPPEGAILYVQATSSSLARYTPLQPVETPAAPGHPRPIPCPGVSASVSPSWTEDSCPPAGRGQAHGAPSGNRLMYPISNPRSSKRREKG